MSTTDAKYSPHLLARARVVRPGVCVICTCTDAFGCYPGCSWEPGTDERLCTAHGDRELAQARAALAAADREKAKPARKAVAHG